MMATCFSTGSGLYWGCFRSSMSLCTTVQLGLGGLVEVGPELRERRQLAVLGKVKAERTGNLLHGLDLGITAHAGNRDTHVDGGPEARVEEVGIQEDLPVGNGNNICGDVCRYVTGLGFNNGQGRERTGAQVVTQLGSALKEAGMQIEHVAGEGLASRGSSAEEAKAACRTGPAW